MKVILLRGLPGSGKSTWVRNHAPDAVVCSADHFFTAADGTYAFDVKKLGRAHRQCQDKFLLALSTGSPLIVVDNTNLKNADLKYYVGMAQDFDAGIEIRTLVVDVETSAARNVHGVPADHIARMQAKTQPLRPEWEQYEVVEDANQKP